jgi:hypothetical protein
MSNVECYEAADTTEAVKTNGILDQVENPICRKFKNTNATD